jgi:predicted dehydrogenase
MPDSNGVGIIGAGFIGRVQAQAARLAGGRLIGITASTPDRSRAAADELGAEQRFADATALIKHPDVDVVQVCTPNDLHSSLVRQALAAGKHVVCEKPLSVSAADAAELTTLAEQAGVVAAVPFSYRYRAPIQEVRARVLADGIGDVHLVHGSYLQDWLLRPEDDNWRVDADRGGPSRAFADIGSHWCDLAEWVTGQRVIELAATASTVIQRRGGAARRATPDKGGTEDLACMAFRATGGMAGTLTVSQVSAGRKNRIWLEIDGADGSLAYDEDQPEQLFIGHRETVELKSRNPANVAPGAHGANWLPPGHPHGFLDGFAAFLAEVYSAARGEAGHEYPSFGDGLRSAQCPANGGCPALQRRAHLGEGRAMSSPQHSLNR